MSTKPAAFARIAGAGFVLPGSEPVAYALPPNLGPPCLAYACAKQPAAGVVPANALRRLGRAQQMALAASSQALDDAGIGPDARNEVAVCVGTGLGELGHTYAFLENMIRNDEEQPKPAAFINSVHNAIAGQLAILLGCKGENHTFLNEACSVESALWQGIHLLNAGRAKTVLVCGVDELNGYMIGAARGLGLYRNSDTPLLPLAENGTSESGTVPGEGAAAFVLTADSEKRSGHTIRVATWSKPILKRDSPGVEGQLEFLLESLERSACGFDEVDFVIFNADGDAAHDAHYRELCRALENRCGRPIPHGVFKHGTGDFHAASAVGIGLCSDIIRGGVLAEMVRWSSTPPKPSPALGLFYNFTRTGMCGLTVVHA